MLVVTRAPIFVKIGAICARQFRRASVKPASPAARSPKLLPRARGGGSGRVNGAGRSITKGGHQLAWQRRTRLPWVGAIPPRQEKLTPQVDPPIGCARRRRHPSQTPGLSDLSRPTAGVVGQGASRSRPAPTHHSVLFKAVLLSLCTISHLCRVPPNRLAKY